MANETPKVVPAIPVPPVEAAPAAPVASTPAQPVYSPPAYAPQPAGPTQGLSIASMVCGIAGLLFSLFAFGFLPSVAAVVTGHIAQKRQPYAKPFWLTGIITGYVGILISVVGVIFVIVFLLIAAASASRYGTPN